MLEDRALSEIPACECDSGCDGGTTCFMRPVRETEFREYLGTFHRVYLEKLRVYLPEEYHDDLVRVRHLSNSRIVGYVSTTYGVGYQYLVGSSSAPEVSHGSRRADAFFFGSTNRIIEDGRNIVIQSMARDLRMVSCSFAGRVPLGLVGNAASATLVDIEWTFRGKSRNLTFAEIFANRSAENWSIQRAIERAMDEVLQACVYVSGMERRHLSIGDYLERFKAGHVLILGDFGPAGSSRIEDIRQVLGERGYSGITLKDLKEVSECDLRQKLVAVASACRFVIVDDSSRAGQQAELPIIEMLRVTTVVMRLRGSDTTFVTRGMSVASNVILEVDYGPDDMEEVLDRAIRWAETKIEDLKGQYANTYPWRAGE